MSMTKEEILKKARDLITGDRNETHGDAFQNHAEIAEFWNIYLDKSYNQWLVLQLKMWH